MQNDEVFNRLQNLIGYMPMQKDIVNKTGINQSTLSTKKFRNSSWTDEEIQKLNTAYNVDIYKEISHNNTENCLTIEYIGINPSCGKGTDIFYNPETSPIQIGINLIKNIFKVSHPASLKTFTASGDSMNPIIEHGDLILVDTGDTDFTNGGVFLITIDNSWFIKRLRQKITGELDIISDNAKYPIETLPLDTFKEVSIKGRVIKNLSRGL